MHISENVQSMQSCEKQFSRCFRIYQNTRTSIRVYINMEFFTFCRDVSMQGCAEMFFHSYGSRKIHFPSNSSDERRILKICACCTTMSTWIFILRFAQGCIFYCCIHARSAEEGMQERTTCVGTSSQIYGSQLRY